MTLPDGVSEGRGGPSGRAAAKWRLRWLRRSVRSRVLAWVLVMAALGMALSGGIVFLFQDRAISGDITEALSQEVAEFQRLAQDGVDPQTGARFASVERLLRVAMQRNVPAREETYLTLLDGVPLEYDGGDRPIALETEEAVLAAVAEAAGSSTVTVREVPTSAGTARLAIVPVSVRDTPGSGTYVIAFAIDQVRAELRGLARLYLLACAVSLLMVGLAGWLAAGRLLRPLRVLRQATQRISETDLSERIPVHGYDELADLTTTYNEMLDRLQAAFAMQRGFLDDAGHELRTPVTIVRGHLELLDPSDPQEVAETRTLLLDEIDRMSRMVEDLILLSKAQRPDFLIPGAVDLADLTSEVAGKARTLGDRDWAIEACGRARFAGDSQRLTQALVELANNAVKFSDPGSAVRIGSSTQDGEIRLWVTDHGRGLNRDERDHVFQRFARGRSSSGVEGSGLGLSIVSAIAQAHGGRVEVDSTPGAGSTFRIVLPHRHPRPSGRRWTTPDPIQKGGAP